MIRNIPPDAEKLIRACLCPNPNTRLTLSEVIKGWSWNLFKRYHIADKDDHNDASIFKCYMFQVARQPWVLQQLWNTPFLWNTLSPWNTLFLHFPMKYTFPRNTDFPSWQLNVASAIPECCNYITLLKRNCIISSNTYFLFYFWSTRSDLQRLKPNWSCKESRLDKTWTNRNNGGKIQPNVQLYQTSECDRAI